MAHSLKQVIYFSSQQLDNGLDAGEAILKILSVSRYRNKLDDITGVLLCSQGHFAQLIEGPPVPIDNLLSRLKRDPRHAYIEIVHDRNVEQRAFAEWSMALIDDEGHCAVRLTEQMKLSTEGKTALTLLRYLVNEPVEATYATVRAGSTSYAA